MAKNKNQEHPVGIRKREILIFRWPRKKEFTVLEDFILRVIESKSGCSDKEIARVLCLDEEDVAVVLDDNDALDGVQGDASRRTLADSFSRNEPDGIAVAAPEGQGGKNKNKYKPPQEIPEAGEDVVALLEKAQRADGAKISSEQLKWRNARKARVYRLAVTVTDNGSKRDFRCGGGEIPPSMLKVLGGFFPRKGKKPAKKAAP